MGSLVKPLVFVPLHAHSTFSFGDGHGTPAEHVARAAELGYTALALTEHGNVSSHFQLEKHALAAGIVPIFGLEAYTGHTDARRQQYKFHLTILARTNEGYRNLNRIVSQSWKEAYYHPTVSYSNLSANHVGLSVLSGCTGSLLACTFIGGKGIPEPDGIYNWSGAFRAVELFQGLFGEHFSLEVQPFWELEKTQKLNTGYAKLSKETGVPLVVTPDIHYCFPEDGEMQAILHAVHRGKHSIDDALRSWNYDVPMTYPLSDRALGERLMKTGLTRDEAWGAILRSREVADECRVTLPKADRLRYPIGEEDYVPW